MKLNIHTLFATLWLTVVAATLSACSDSLDEIADLKESIATIEWDITDVTYNSATVYFSSDDYNFTYKNINYSTSPDFAESETVKYDYNNPGIYQLTNLEPGTKYYVRVIISSYSVNQDHLRVTHTKANNNLVTFTTLAATETLGLTYTETRTGTDSYKIEFKTPANVSISSGTCYYYPSGYPEMEKSQSMTKYSNYFSLSSLEQDIRYEYYLVLSGTIKYETYTETFSNMRIEPDFNIFTLKTQPVDVSWRISETAGIWSAVIEPEIISDNATPCTVSSYGYLEYRIKGSSDSYSISISKLQSKYTLSGLQPNTEYEYQFTNIAVQANYDTYTATERVDSPVRSFTTKSAPADYTSTITELSATSASIEITFPEDVTINSTLSIYYSASPDDNYSFRNFAANISPDKRKATITLSGLMPSTSYYFYPYGPTTVVSGTIEESAGSDYWKINFPLHHFTTTAEAAD